MDESRCTDYGILAMIPLPPGSACEWCAPTLLPFLQLAGVLLVDMYNPSAALLKSRREKLSLFVCVYCVGIIATKYFLQILVSW